MPFEAFKREVFAIAKRENVMHLCPNMDDLFTLWEKGVTPSVVVTVHCTVWAQQQRLVN